MACTRWFVWTRRWRVYRGQVSPVGPIEFPLPYYAKRSKSSDFPRLLPICTSVVRPTSVAFNWVSNDLEVRSAKYEPVLWKSAGAPAANIRLGSLVGKMVVRLLCVWPWGNLDTARSVSLSKEGSERLLRVKLGFEQRIENSEDVSRSFGCVRSFSSFTATLHDPPFISTPDGIFFSYLHAYCKLSANNAITREYACQRLHDFSQPRQIPVNWRYI